jgi:hypothetical protein
MIAPRSALVTESVDRSEPRGPSSRRSMIMRSKMLCGVVSSTFGGELYSSVLPADGLWILFGSFSNRL